MTPESLLAAIFDDPFDIELRRVYGDLLLERGDPRGEFVQLQLAHHDSGVQSPEQHQRERELLDRYGADWLGPLAAVVSYFRFERGFLVEASIPTHRKEYNVQRTVGHPVWSTVEHFFGPSSVYLDPGMRALRDLAAPQVDGIDALCGGPIERPIRQLRCRFWRPPEIVYRAPALPALTYLQVESIRKPEELRAIAPVLARHIRELALDRMDIRYADLRPWFDTMALFTVPTITLVEPHWSVTRWRFTRSERGLYDELFVDGTEHGDLARPLATLVGCVQSVALRIARPFSAKLEAVLAQFPRVTVAST